MTVPANGSAAQAAQILTKAGYKKDSAGYFALNGKEVKLTIVDPSSAPTTPRTARSSPRS